MISVIKKIRKILNKAQKVRIIILFLMMVIGAFFEVLGVSLMLPLVKAIMQPDIINTNKWVKMVCEAFDLHSHRTFVVVCIIALIIVFIVKDLYLLFENYVQIRFICNNRFATEQRVLRAILSRPYEYFLEADRGEINRMINNDVDGVYQLIGVLLGMATETAVTFSITVTVFVIDPMISCFLAAILLILVVMIIKVLRPILAQMGKRGMKYSGDTWKWQNQAVNGIKEIKVTNTESFFEDNYEINGKKMIGVEKVKSVLEAAPRLLIEMTSVCSILALIGYMIYRGKPIEELAPTLGAFAMAALKLMPGANRIVAAVNAVTYYKPYLDALSDNLDILKNSIDASERKTDEEILYFEKNIELRNLTYSYPNSEKHILDEANMVVPRGKSVGIVGTSGAGKTTAVDVMLGLLEPQSGHVYCDGKDVMKNYSSWLEMIGYIPQSIFMIDDTIRANVAFGVETSEIDDEKVWHALEEAQLANFVKDLPNGINTGIGANGIRLSGGQRQRIGIARALYKNPQLLVFDEATSALDNETEAAIMEAINSLHGKKTMVIIAHRLQTIDGCDMVYRVAEGKITRER